MTIPIQKKEQECRQCHSEGRTYIVHVTQFYGIWALSASVDASLFSISPHSNTLRPYIVSKHAQDIR
jgi:hypothetical protein